MLACVSNKNTTHYKIEKLATFESEGGIQSIIFEITIYTFQTILNLLSCTTLTVNSREVDIFNGN